MRNSRFCGPEKPRYFPGAGRLSPVDCANVSAELIIVDSVNKQAAM